MSAWSEQDIEKLRKLYEAKPAYITDLKLATALSSQFNKSIESIRWKIREFRREVTKVSPPKILILDIETLPIEALVWDVWNQNINMEQIEKDWSVLSWAAKWLFDTNVMGASVTAAEAKAHEDISVLRDVWKLLDEADLVITHNGDRFDFKRLNARFFIHGLPKPMYYKSIDTWRVAKDNFDLTYGKLDWIARVTGIGRKVETKFEWWKECHEGNQKYLDLMLEYNKWDVNLEEEAYLKLRPWMTNHPNMNLFTLSGDVPCCPTCGGLDLHWNGKYSTPLGLYKAFRCQSCGTIGRSTKKQYKLAAAVAQN